MTAWRDSSLPLLLAAGVAGVMLGARLMPAREATKALIPAGEYESASTPAVSYDGRQLVFSGRRASDGVTGIWEMAVGDTKARLVTRGNGYPVDPVYLPDDRILYSDAVFTDRAGPGEARALFSCRDDGTELARLTFGGHVDGRAGVLRDGRVGFERRFGSSISRRSSIRMTIHPDGTQVAFAGDGDQPAVTSGGTRLPQVRPPILTSVVSADRSTGTLLCLNVYESRLPEIVRLAPGSIRSVLVRQEGQGTSAESLGEAPVHADGSFFIEVPADVALRLTLLGEDRRPLASLDSGIWVRPNENRGCIGCHEEPDLAPENRRPLAIAEPAAPLAIVSPVAGVNHAD